MSLISKSARVLANHKMESGSQRNLATQFGEFWALVSWTLKEKMGVSLAANSRYIN